MTYETVVAGHFLERPNRFIARVRLEEGEETVVHVKNTGRCRELLIPGAPVYLQDWGKEHLDRKTRYDLIAVEKGALLVNIDSQAPNQVFAQWAQEGHFVQDLSVLRSEYRWGNSRFDFYWEAGARRGLTEVKGVTLETGGHALFPDAPTLRGVKHLEELIRARKEGYEAAICFIIQMEGMHTFSPNDETHPAFGDALRRAAAAGVGILALECCVTPTALQVTRGIAVEL